MEQEVAQLAPVKDMFQDMMKDIGHTLRSIQEQRLAREVRRGNVPVLAESMGGDRNDFPSPRRVSTNDETFLSELKKTMETAIQPLGLAQQQLMQGQQRMIEICKRSRHKGTKVERCWISSRTWPRPFV